MPFGIVELISLLMGLQGFGLQSNPRPATADQALEYAIVDADVVTHFDVASVIPGNYRVLAQLADQPQIKSSPELSKVVRKAFAEVDGPRGLMKSQTGIDPTTDISDLTVFVRVVPKHKPDIVVAVHGTFSAATIDKLAKLAHGQVVKVGAQSMAELDTDGAVGVSKDGVLLAGTRPLVRDRLADGWKPPAHAAGSTLGHAADVIGAKPVFAVVVALSPAARAEALANTTTPNFGTDLIARHKLAAFAVFHDGIGWTWMDSTKAGLEAMTTFSDGLIDVLRAAQIAPRGFAKIALGALDSYKKDPRVAELLKRRGDLLKIVDAFTGDGKFAVKVDQDAKSLKLSVRASGKTLSDVVPIGVLVPLGALFFVGQRGTASVTPMQKSMDVEPVRAPPAPPRRK